MSENTTTRKRSLLAVGAFVCLVALTGCDSVGAPTPAPTTTSGGSPDQPTPTTQAPTTSAPSPSSAQPTGCPANGGEIPAEADTAEIGDVDGDGLADTQWYSEADAPFSYGITTASGATATVRDDLAGPGRHSGWSAKLSNGAVATVIDDGRGASLHAFVDCEFVTPFGVNGKPYRFDMQNRYGNGTGVGCRSTADGLELLGLQTTRRNDGTYDVTATQVIVLTNRTTAENGETVTVANSVPKDDPAVDDARVSACSDTSIVRTSGR